MMVKHKIIWLYGLSGAGKTTLGLHLKVTLEKDQHKVVLLDGDSLRYGLNKDLGFQDSDRSENIRRASEMARILHDNGIICICCLITPLEEHRQLSKNILGEDVIQVYVDCPIAECERRDVKGLYEKARQNRISNFTGITAPFEKPFKPELTIGTYQTSIQQCVKEILAYLAREGQDESK